MKDVFNLGFLETSPLVIIEKICSLKTKKAILKLLKQAWDNDSEKFFIGLQISLDCDVDFKCTKVPAWDDDGADELLDFEKFYELYIMVKNNKLTETEINSIILEMANSSGSKEWNLFYRKILLKKLQDDLPMDIIIEFLKGIEEKSTNVPQDVSVVLQRK
ncbi:MAG: hypothetical protein [Caudoviricetes sp.]|nr:MAG: hypothetical protein [Caudoviricetes sp.]